MPRVRKTKADEVPSIEVAYPSGEGVRYRPLPSPANVVVIGPDDPIWSKPSNDSILFSEGAYFYIDPPPGFDRKVLDAILGKIVNPAATRVRLPAELSDVEIVVSFSAEIPAEHGVRDVVREEAEKIAGPLLGRVIEAAEEALSGAGL